MEKYLNKILIIDGSYALHRCLHQPNLAELETTTGIKSGGVFGVMKMLQSEIKRFPGYMPIFCWDKGLSPRRTTLYPDYKANRKRLEADAMLATGIKDEKDIYLEEYHRQRDDLIVILKCLGIPSILENGWEGDDIQYILSRVCEEGVIVTDDKDLIQLVAPNIKIRRAMRDEIISWEESDIHYRHPHFTIAKSIIGDESDNILQVAQGVGDKSADQIAYIIDMYGDDVAKYKEGLINFINDPENGKKPISKKVKAVLDNWDKFIINYNLINLRLVEPPIGFENLIQENIKITLKQTNLFTAYSLIGKYEMNTIFPDQIIAAISIASSTVLK